MSRPHKCPYCGSSATVSKGVRKTKHFGDRRIRRCKACHRKFTPKHQRHLEDDNEWKDVEELAGPISEGQSTGDGHGGSPPES